MFIIELIFFYDILIKKLLKSLIFKIFNDNYIFDKYILII